MKEGIPPLWGGAHPLQMHECVCVRKCLALMTRIQKSRKVVTPCNGSFNVLCWQDMSIIPSRTSEREQEVEREKQEVEDEG